MARSRYRWFIVFLLFGYPVAFSLAACGLFFGFVGIELGTIEVERTAAAQNDPLFATLPQRFAAQSAHRQSVRRLPAGAVLLAGNAFEPHHAYRVGARAWGVQFHPEFSAAATAAYVRAVGTAAEPAPQVGSSEASATVLQRFAEVVAASTQPASG